MKKFVITAIILIGLSFSSNATVLFPHFVDIAPNYEEGNTPELADAGVECAMYHSTKPGFMASNFTEVEQLFQDTLPSDVMREETKAGDATLVIYTSINTKNDAISTNALKCTIYVLQRSDDSFVAAYCEQEVEP